VGVLLFPFYVRACSPTRASSKRNPTSELSLKSVLFSRLFRSLHRRCLFLVSSHPSQTEVRVRVSEASSVYGENASSFAINRGKKNTRENAFSFFFASRRSQTENIENIMYRYAPFFISNLLNASDRDESPDENCRRRRSRAEKKKKKRRKERARARDRRTVSSSKRRRRGGGGRGEGDAFASVAAREEVPGYLGGGVEVSEHDGC